MLDYKLIEALAMVIQEGGFDKAAGKLHLTQSAISQRVRLLEENAGQILLTRTSPPVPTSAGIRFLKHYHQVKRLEGDLDGSIFTHSNKQHESLSIALNADSLETWFTKAVDPFLRENSHITLDIKVDDQEETHKMLKNGEVAGCISARKSPIQGCTATSIGIMNYRLIATPAFIGRYFPEGLTLKSVAHAPAVIFNRKDNLHTIVLKKVFKKTISHLPAHYVPSTEKFAEFIIKGHAYGVIPDEQSSVFLSSGELIDLAPDHNIPVELYWHCWNIKSKLLQKFTEALSSGMNTARS